MTPADLTSEVGARNGKNTTLSNSLPTTLPETKKAGKSPQFSAGFRGKNDTPTPGIISPSRRRTIKRAKRIVTDAGIRGRARVEAFESIILARQPIASAKRIVGHHKKQKLALDVGDEIDLSNVQEVRVRLIRRDGGIWPPQSTLLGKIERKILTEGMTPDEFREAAVVVVGMAQALLKNFRRQESIAASKQSRRNRLSEKKGPAHEM